MIFFLKGIVQELSPTYVIIDVNGVGYYVGISLQTSNKLNLGKETFIYTQQIIREDAHLLFGFHTKEEKEMFNLLISVNGVGAVSVCSSFCRKFYHCRIWVKENRRSNPCIFKFCNHRFQKI